MKWILRIICLIAALWFVNTELFATHNRAGEITYEQIGPLTIRITLVTYTKTSSHVDRDSLIVYWGDGTSETIGRINEGRSEERRVGKECRARRARKQKKVREKKESSSRQKRET